MTIIDRLRGRLAEIVAERDATLAEIEALTAELEDNDTPETRAEVDGRFARLDDLDARIGELSERIERLEAAEERAATARTLTGPADRAARVVDEPRTYTPQSARDGVSFFADLVRRTSDSAAAERLARHEREHAVETRDVGTGAFAGLTVPQYLTDLVAPLRRAGRPFADIAQSVPLPDRGMTVELSRITTGSSAAVQVTENSAVSETDMDDTVLSVPVRTIAGQQDVSRQVIERSTNVDVVVARDLVSAHDTALDSQLLNGSGASGQHLGVRNVAGIISVAYTDTTPTVPELYPKFADLIQQVQAATFTGITHFVMHPRRWWWIAQALGTSFPLLQFPATAPQVAGNVGDTSYESTNRLLFGVPVVLDGNVPTSLGAGTNEDVIIGVTATELWLWEQAGSPLFVRADEVGIGTLTVKFVAYSFTAFAAGRYPAAHGVITGTGLVPPTF